MLRILQKSSRSLAVILTILAIVGAALWAATRQSADLAPDSAAEAELAEARPQFVPVVLDEAPAEVAVEEVAVEEVEAVEEVAVVEEPAPEVEAELLVGQAKARKEAAGKARERETYKQAVLQIVTNFEKADVTVNGLPYPEYVAPGEPEGVVLPAGGPYYVEVTYDGKSKSYQLHLRPYETRLLIVELSGYQGSSTAPRPVPAPRAVEKQEEEKEEEEEGEQGKVTVYSKPPGTVIIDGDKRSDKTPGTVDVEAGRHEVQVEYEDGGISEKKIVRVRKGSRIKLFFRKRND